MGPRRLPGLWSRNGKGTPAGCPLSTSVTSRLPLEAVGLGQDLEDLFVELPGADALVELQEHRNLGRSAVAQLAAHFGIDPLGTIASGALLVAVAAGDADRVVRACAEQGIACAQIATAVDPARGVKLVTGDEERELPRFDQDEVVRAL